MDGTLAMVSDQERLWLMDFLLPICALGLVGVSHVKKHLTTKGT